ncbi:MAG: hypothetical protein CVU71_10175 [Deltaproteobacteria bacterium HGW-Deltaproteobacteria-6]|jgi:hypothetical protein|nr:MAG: hypothetical protein CVU71_10175 [Deltaproteobacteria bacterium HGW-Deltaproteobacteria-6]
MKLRAFLPAFIALIILTGSPFGSLMRVAERPHGGLECFCCQDSAKPCVMISCSCCNDQTDRDMPQWMPEMIFTPHHSSVSIKPVYTQAPCFLMPESICMDVPVLPPEPVRFRIASV